MEIEPVFEVGSDGTARPVFGHERDGRRYLWTAEAAAITGQRPEALAAAYRAVFDLSMFGEPVAASPEIPAEPPAGPAVVPTYTFKVDDDRVRAKRDRMVRALKTAYFWRLNDQDVLDAAYFARRRGLDPWSGHVWADRLPVEDGDGDRLVVGLTAEGFRSVACEHPLFGGYREMEYFYDVVDGQRVLTKCRSTAYRLLSQGGRVKVVTSALWSSANQGTRLWLEKPEQMLGIAARNANIREAFGGRAAGLYSPEELARRWDRREGERPADRPRKPKRAGPSPAEGITSPGQLRRVLITEYGVRGKDGVERAYAALRATFAHLSDEDPAFYDAALAEVREHPERYGATLPLAAKPVEL